MTQSMTGKITLISLAAGSLGLATATLLATRGATIAASDIAGTDFGQLCPAIPNAQRLLVVLADVKDEAAFGAVAARTVNVFGKVA